MRGEREIIAMHLPDELSSFGMRKIAFLLAVVLLLLCGGCEVFNRDRIAARRSAIERVEQLRDGMSKREAEDILRPYSASKKHPQSTGGLSFWHYTLNDWSEVDIGYRFQKSKGKISVPANTSISEKLLVDKDHIYLWMIMKKPNKSQAAETSPKGIRETFGEK